MFDDDDSSLFKADSQSDDKMSLKCSNSINPGKEDAKCDEDEENDDGFAADDGAAVWLESIGLDKKNFPSLDPRKVKLYPFLFPNMSFICIRFVFSEMND